MALATEVEIGAGDAEQDYDGRRNIITAPTGAGVLAVFFGGGLEGKTLDFLVVGCGSHVTDRHHDDGRDAGDQNAEILKIDIIDDPQERSLGIAVLEAGKAESDGSIYEHAGEAQNEAYHHGPESALGIETLEENTKEKHDEDGRGKIALDSLKIVVEALSVLDDGNPGEVDQHHHGGGD